MARNKGWAKLRWRMRTATMLVCGLCDKPTNFLAAARRQQPAQAATHPNLSDADLRYKSEWQCSHCGAWHALDKTEYGVPTEPLA